jgi:hypothetical protein
MSFEMNAARQLAEYLTGKWISHAIHAAAELSIADVLAEHELSVDELAEQTGAHAPSLYRLLRALASIGIFHEASPQRFRSTVASDLLRRGAMRSAALMAHSSWHDGAWAQLVHSVRTGESGFEKAQGAPLFEWLNRHPDANTVFSETMTAGAAYRERGIATAYDFSACRRVVDVGGGHGSLMISLLQQYPDLNGVIADLPAVAAGARQALERAGLSERCEVVGCDFFEHVPAGSDAYLLAHVLHDWDDDRCIKILGSCRAAMMPSAKVLLVESLLSPGDQPDRAKWLDLEMLVLTSGGRERTRDEYAALLRAAGLRLQRVIATEGSRNILEAERE